MSFGTDTWCDTALQPGRLVTGTLLVAQALFRRCITPAGTLRGGDEPTRTSDEAAAYGFDVAGYVGQVGTDTATLTLPGRLRAEFMKDDRVSDVAVKAFKSQGSDGLIDITLDASVTLHTGETFDLTLTADEFAVSIAETTAQ